MHQSCTLLYLSLLVPLLSPGFVFGRLIAKYIDDEYGDLETGEKPEFKGGRWIRGGVCEGCAPGGALKPNPGLAFNGSWHDNTRHTKDPIRSVAFNFTGISVEIFCILPNKHSDGVTVAYDISFVLDGQLVGHFTHSPDPKADFTYNKSVFSKDNLLPDTKHTMEVTLDSNTTDTVLLFDYAKYEVEYGTADVLPTTRSLPPTSLPLTSLPLTSFPPASSPPTSPSSVSSPDNNERLAIIFAIVFGIILAITVCLLLIWLRRKPRQPDTSSEPTLQPLPFPLVDRKNTPRGKGVGEHHSGIGEPSSRNGGGGFRSWSIDGDTMSAPPLYDTLFTPANTQVLRGPERYRTLLPVVGIPQVG